MNFLLENSVFEVLNDNHEYFLGTSDILQQNSKLKPCHLSRTNNIEQEISFSEFLNDNHDLYLDLSDIYPEIPHKFPGEFDTKSNNKNINTKSVQLSMDSIEKSLEYLTFIQKEYETHDRAARKIQNYWKGYIQRKTFNQIKTLIIKYSNSNPVTVLRFVNPKEAELLDKASGAYVKFKLIGNNFPPKIVYKIVSRTPIIKIDPHKIYESKLNKGTMTNWDRVTEDIPNSERAAIENKNDGKNNWRYYVANRHCCAKKRNKIYYRPRSSPKLLRPKSLDRKMHQISWIKNQYGF